MGMTTPVAAAATAAAVTTLETSEILPERVMGLAVRSKPTLHGVSLQSTAVGQRGA